MDMKIKDRFTIYRHSKAFGDIFYDNLQNKQICGYEANRIIMKEYGVQILHRKQKIKEINQIIKEYNSSCEEGFEINEKDVL